MYPSNGLLRKSIPPVRLVPIILVGIEVVHEHSRRQAVSSDDTFETVRLLQIILGLTLPG